MKDGIKQTSKYSIAVVKTLSAGLGAVVYRTGKAIIFLEDITQKFNLADKRIKYLIIGISSASVFYTIVCTRLPSLWKKFEPKHDCYVEIKNNDEVTINLSKNFNRLAYIIFISRAPFHALNTYAGAHAVLNIVSPENINVLSATLGLYITVSAQATYFAYTFESIKKNCQKIANHMREWSNNSRNKFTIKAVVNVGLKIFLNSGALSFGALSFFVTKKALLVIPYVNRIPNIYLNVISSLSAITGISSCILSKNMELNHFIDEDAIQLLKRMNKPNSVLIYPHSLIGLIFTVCMGAGYFDGSFNLFKDLGITTLKFFSENPWILFTLSMIFALSGGAMDFAFSVKPMLEQVTNNSKNEEIIENIPLNNNLQNSINHDREDQKVSYSKKRKKTLSQFCCFFRERTEEQRILASDAQKNNDNTVNTQEKYLATIRT